jgi:hypothetical protein
MPVYFVKNLIGGSPGDLNALGIDKNNGPPGQELNLINGDVAVYPDSADVWLYRFSAADSDAQSLPDIVRPNDFSTAGVWKRSVYGSGSGLDADTIQMLVPSQFMRSDQNTSTTGDISTPSGVIIVQGNKTVVEVTNYSALRNLDANISIVHVNGASGSGDGGDGIFKYFSGGSPGTYTDDSGVTIVPTGGDGSAAWIRQFTGDISPKWYGAVGDGSTDDRTAIVAAINKADDINGYGTKVDLGGASYAVGSTIELLSEFNIGISNGEIRPTATGFAAGTPLIDINGAGNIMFDTVLIDCNHISDGIKWQTGANKFVRCRISGPVNYGMEIDNGTDGVIEDCRFQEWSFSSAENGDGTSRVSTLLVVKTGDITVHNTVLRYANKLLSIEGATVLIHDSHFYNGAEAGTTQAGQKCYGIYIESTANNTVFRGCYFDKAIIRVENPYKHSIDACNFLRNGVNEANGTFIEFAPQTTGTTLLGTSITSNRFAGSDAGSPFAADSFFTVDTTSGTITDMKGCSVTNNVYGLGSASYTKVPSTRGSVTIRQEVGEWTSDSGAYKSGYYDLTDYMFLRSNFSAHAPYKLVCTPTKRTGFAPGTTGNLAIQNSTTNIGEYQFWSSTNDDINIHIMWDAGENNEVL